MGILYNRAAYTVFNRDKRHWNRRYISLGEGGIFEGSPVCPSSGSSINLGQEASKLLDRAFSRRAYKDENVDSTTGLELDASGNVIAGAAYDYAFNQTQAAVRDSQQNQITKNFEEFYNYRR
jgi:hypothetical protein